MAPATPVPSAAAERRALSRRVRDAFPPLGVYAVREAATGRVLRVLASRHVPAALQRLAFELRLRSHRDRALQALWDAGGEAALRCEVLAMVQPSTDPAFDPDAELAGLLQAWREELGVPA